MARAAAAAAAAKQNAPELVGREMTKKKKGRQGRGKGRKIIREEENEKENFIQSLHTLTCVLSANWGKNWGPLSAGRQAQWSEKCGEKKKFKAGLKKTNYVLGTSTNNNNKLALKAA